MLSSEWEQKDALARLYELAAAELNDALRLAIPGDSASVADVIMAYVPQIADRYGLAAGVLAAQWYEQQRADDDVPGSFTPEPAPLPDLGRYQAMAGWAAGGTALETLVAGGVQRVIANAHRETIMRSAYADPQAEGWARFSRGASTCSFCTMLVTRGAVYDESTAKFGTHDHCNCAAGPVWKGRAGARKVDAYRKSLRRVEDAEGNAVGATARDQERARQWIADNAL